MRSRKRSPSERFVAAVISFVAGQHLYGKPRISTFELMLEARKLNRMTKEIQKKYPINAKGV